MEEIKPDILMDFTGHSDNVNSVAFSPDGTKIVSGSLDNTVKVWDVNTGNVITNFTGHSGTVYSVAFSPDGTKIVSGSDDRTVKVYGSPIAFEAVVDNLVPQTRYYYRVVFKGINQ